MFEYLLSAERDIAVAAIYRALLRLFEAKGGSRSRVGVPDRLSSKVSSGSEVERLCARVLFDIMDEEKQELASISREAVSRYTGLLAGIASSRYTAGIREKSQAARFLKQIDPANAENGLAVR
jgi:hypothetical protein